MSNTGQNVKDEVIRNTAFGDITASFVALGSALIHDSFDIVLVNGTDKLIEVSLDGVNVNKKFKAGQSRIYDYKTNDMYRKAGTQFYIRHTGDAPTSGAVWLEVEYV